MNSRLNIENEMKKYSMSAMCEILSFCSQQHEISGNTYDYKRANIAMNKI